VAGVVVLALGRRGRTGLEWRKSAVRAGVRGNRADVDILDAVAGAPLDGSASSQQGCE
jgi:hypothetical protein